MPIKLRRRMGATARHCHCHRELRRDGGFSRGAILAARASSISTCGRLTTSLQRPSVSTCRINCRFFWVYPSWRCCSSVVRISSRRSSAGWSRQPVCCAIRSTFQPKINRADLRLFAVPLPVGIDDFFDDVGVKKRAQRGQALDRHVQPSCHPGECDQLRAPIGNRCRRAGLEPLAANGVLKLARPAK